MESTAAETRNRDTAALAAEIAANRERYGIDRWGGDYFDISPQGNVVVKAPLEQGVQPVELVEIVDGLKRRGLEMPVMLRLENVLDDRIATLNRAFRKAIRTCGYGNEYRGVFPIKVNQQQQVIAEIARAGAVFGHGLEVGSKAELLIALASLENREGLIVCNGYKDAEFVDLGLQAIRAGYRCFFVLETPQELPIIMDRAEHWNVKPLIGVRLKLSTPVDGHWAGDSGDQSLFGLSTRQIMEVVDTMRDAGQLHCLQLLHFHLGSQIPNIRNIRDGVHEACRYYIELVHEGAPMGWFNLGGGLAVDYDGSGTISANSRNYDLEEYCVDVVEAIAESLDPHGIPHPLIISESGRWTAAPMSVLLFNVLSVSNFDPDPLPDPLPGDLSEPLQNLQYTLDHIEPRRLQESFNDAIYYRDQMRQAFRTGVIHLRERALGENICLMILNRIARLARDLPRPPADLAELQRKLGDIYYGNFSVFQSLPDAWAIEQVFPVLPLHRLDERPSRAAIIADLTCDCDGKLNRFVGRDENESTLMLHEIPPGEEYFLGVFLVGAYQETLGDLHNLFGDTNVASVRVNSQGQLEFVQEIHGDSIADVLSYVEYQPQDLYQRYRQLAEEAVRDGRISVEQRKEMLNLYAESLRGYTYFENP